MSKQTTAATWYADVFKAWPKAAGAKPTVAQLEAAHMFGKPGKQSLALAMAMRDSGVTAPQVELTCERPQNNHRVRAIKLGYFTRVPTPADGAHTVYKIALTAKGQQRVGGGVSMAKPAPVAVKAKPVKAAKVAKAKRAKPVKPAADAVAVTEPAVQADAVQVADAVNVTA